jgi:indole-3-glycerol phosphate synthase
MTDLLQEICTRKLEHITACQRATPLAVLETHIAKLRPPRDFVGALQAKRKAGLFGLIAEMKRASPSAGSIRPDFDPATIALAYKTGGAACLSILTDQPYFKGQDADIAAAAPAGLPILRKDFMLTPYQIAETRALGGDCVLLIMAALSNAQAGELQAAAQHYGLAVLIEVHDAHECDRALLLPAEPASMIGINNRNLKNLQIDLNTTRSLAERIPKDRIIVSESGLRSHADLQNLREFGADCFLIGEHLLIQADLVAATRKMLGS